MRIQRDDWSCGAVCAANVIRAVTGRRVSEKDTAKDAGTTPKHGTQEHGLIQAFVRAGLETEELIAPFPQAYRRLRDHLEAGHAAALLVEVGDHWVSALGMSGHRIIAFDSQPNARRGGESGLLLLAKDRLRRYWTAQPSKDGGIGRARYAVLVKQP